MKEIKNEEMMKVEGGSRPADSGMSPGSKTETISKKDLKWAGESKEYREKVDNVLQSPSWGATVEIINTVSDAVAGRVEGNMTKKMGS